MTDSVPITVIPDALLRATDVPGPDASWDQVARFALSFNGYSYWGSFDSASRIAQRVEALRRASRLDLASLSELRTALFFMQRAARHTDSIPEGDDADGWRALVGEIRQRCAASTSTIGDADRAPDPCPRLWFGCFVDGLRREESLLITLMPRVALEASVVAAAALGLQHVTGDGPLQVRIEATLPGVPGRIDMVVDGPSDGPRWAFEWKQLWQLGFGENIAGIRKDLAKLRGVRSSAVLVFAYAVREAPEFCQNRTTSTPLSATVAAASAELGAPYRRSEVFAGDVHGTIAEYQLIAWLPP